MVRSSTTVENLYSYVPYHWWRRLWHIVHLPVFVHTHHGLKTNRIRCSQYRKYGIEEDEGKYWNARNYFQIKIVVYVLLLLPSVVCSRNQSPFRTSRFECVGIAAQQSSTCDCVRILSRIKMWARASLFSLQIWIAVIWYLLFRCHKPRSSFRCCASAVLLLIFPSTSSDWLTGWLSSNGKRQNVIFCSFSQHKFVLDAWCVCRTCEFVFDTPFFPIWRRDLAHSVWLYGCFFAHQFFSRPIFPIKY